MNKTKPGKDTHLNLLVIFNPRAAFGRSGKKLTVIQSYLHRLGIHSTFKSTQSPGHGCTLVANTALAEFDAVVAAGGDGTVFEVVNGLYQHEKPARIPLGVLPIGTGNAFARDLGLAPGAWREAIALIQKGHIRQVDVGHVSSPDDEYYFLNVVGMGFAVDAGLSARKLKFIGNTAYTLASLWQSIKLKSYPLLLELDGREIRQDNVLLEISNTRFTGTDFLIAPGAVIDDGLLDVTLLRRLPRLRLLKLFPGIYSGRHVHYPEVSTYQASSIAIHAPAGMLLAPDGEFRGNTPVSITCLKQDLSLFSPPSP